MSFLPNDMESNTHYARAAFFESDGDADSVNLTTIYVELPKSEYDDSSDMESFNEDDIYDGSENSDEIIYHNIDSHMQLLDDMVCLQPRQQLRKSNKTSPMTSVHLGYLPLTRTTLAMDQKAVMNLMMSHLTGENQMYGHFPMAWYVLTITQITIV